MSKGVPDQTLMESSSPGPVISALHIASAALRDAGVRHLVVGGLAVAAYGYGRSTKDVHFLVGDEAFEHHPRGIVSMRPGVPIQVSGVLVDFLSIGKDEMHLEVALSTRGDVAPLEVLVYLKLKLPRAKDRVDVIELMKAGVDANRCREYLATNAPALLPKLDECMAAARAED